MTPFDASGKEAFQKHCGKRRNCLYKQFLLFPQCFSTLSKTEIIGFFFTFHLSSANAFNLVWSKILSCGNGLISMNQTKCRQMYCIICIVELVIQYISRPLLYLTLSQTTNFRLFQTHSLHTTI